MKKKNKNKIKNNDVAIFIYVCILISFISCIILRSLIIIENPLKSIIITLLFFIPTIISIILVLLNKGEKIKLKTANIIQALIIVPSVIYIFILVFVSLIIELNDGGVNNKINYRRVYSYYNFDYFPKKIPKIANNIVFHYNPPLLQGGEIFSLYFKCDESIIKHYDEKYKKYKLENNSAEKQEIMKFNKSFLYYTPYSDNYNKINDFTIYSLYRECDDSGYCNHGEIKLIAIDNNTREIIFYYENW